MTSVTRRILYILWEKILEKFFHSLTSQNERGKKTIPVLCVSHFEKEGKFQGHGLKGD